MKTLEWIEWLWQRKACGLIITSIYGLPNLFRTGRIKIVNHRKLLRLKVRIKFRPIAESKRWVSIPAVMEVNDYSPAGIVPPPNKPKRKITVWGVLVEVGGTKYMERVGVYLEFGVDDYLHFTGEGVIWRN